MNTRFGLPLKSLVFALCSCSLIGGQAREGNAAPSEGERRTTIHEGKGKVILKKNSLLFPESTKSYDATKDFDVGVATGGTKDKEGPPKAVSICDKWPHLCNDKF